MATTTIRISMTIKLKDAIITLIIINIIIIIDIIITFINFIIVITRMIILVQMIIFSTKYTSVVIIIKIDMNFNFN